MKTIRLLLAIAILAICYSGYSAAISSTATGGMWSATGSWSGGVVPGSGDDVTIVSGATITIDGADVCKSITLSSGSTLTVSGTNTLTVSGNWTNNGGTFNRSTGTVTFNATSTIGGSSSTTFNNLTVSSGTATAGVALIVNGTLTTSSGATLDMSTFTLTGTLNPIANAGKIKTSCTANPPFTANVNWSNGSQGTVEFAVTGGGQYIPAGPYYKLHLDNTSGTNTAVGGLNIANALTTSAGGTLDMSTFDLGSSFSPNCSGTIKTSSLGIPFPGNKTWGGTIQYAVSGQSVINGTYNNLTFLHSSGTSTANGNITVNGALTTTAGGTLDMGTINQLLGTLATITNNGTIKTAWINPSPFPASKTWGGTIEYYGAAQSVASGTYNNLTLSGSGAKTIDATTKINALSIAPTGTATASLAASTNYYIPTLKFAGTTQSVGTYNYTSSPTYFANTTGSIIVPSCAGFWQGTTNTDWGTGTNWCDGNVPTSSTNVVIPSGGNQPTISATAICKDITISTGATLTLSASNTLNVYGNWTNNGAFTKNLSLVNFCGSSVQSIGGGVTTFYSLTISNTSATVSLAANSNVSQTLTVNAGSTLSLSTFTLGASTVTNTTNLTCGTTASTITGTGVFYLNLVNVTATGSGNSANITTPVNLGTVTCIFTVAAQGSSLTDLTISSVISNTGDVSKAGAGIMLLSGLNTYSGITTITAGTLKIGAAGDGTNSPLGTIAGYTYPNGGVLDLNGFTLSTAEPLQLSGTGISNGGALTNSSATAVSYSGLITQLNGGSSIIANAGDINMTNVGSITGGGNLLTLGGTGNGSFASILAGAGQLTKSGTGTWTVSGASTYAGNTNITAGTLKLGAAGGSTNTPLGTTGAGTIVSSGATLDLNGFTLGTTEALSLNGTGVGGNGALINSGAAATYSGLITLAGTSSIVGGTGAINISNAGAITGTYNLTLGGSAGGSITSVLQLSSGTITIAAGTWTLSGLNSYTGLTTINNGATLKLGAAGNSSNGPLGTTTNGTTVNSGGVLDLNGFTLGTSEALTINSTGISSGGALINSSGTAVSYTGAITLGSASSISTTGNISLGGGITGGQNLTKIGAGTLSLGSSTATLGALTISAGTLTSTSGTMSLTGAFTNNSTFTHNSGTVSLGTGASIGGSNATAFYNLTINTTSASDIVTLTTSGASVNYNSGGGTLTLTQGIFKIGAGNTFKFNGNGAIITNTANGTLATTGSNGADGGRIIFSSTGGGSMNINGSGALTFYDLIVGGYTTGSANTSVNQNNTNVLINDSLRWADNNAAWNTNSPKYSSNATLYINYNGQQYTPGASGKMQWSATSGYSIGSTAGYPNNVTLVNVVNPSTISQSNAINGILTLGDASAGTKTGIVTISGGTAGAFSCGGINISYTGSTLTAPAANMTIKGNFTKVSGATFTHSSGTVTFAGVATQTITDPTATDFYNIAIANGTTVQLGSPITLPTAGALTLTSGILKTDASNILTISNPANTGISGGSTSSFINGPVIWTLGTASTGTYTVPVGVYNSGYYPFAFVSGTIASANPTIQVQATASYPGVTSGNAADGSSLLSTSTTEYWKIITTGSTFASSAFSIARSTPALTGINGIGASTTNANTSYSLVSGTTSSATVSGQSGWTVTSGLISGASTNYLALATKQNPTITLAENAGGQVPQGNIATGSTINPIYTFQTTIGTASASLTGLTFTTTGSYSSTDISNFKLYYSTTGNIFSTANPQLVSGATISSTLGTGSHSFTSLSSTPFSISVGTIYFWITTDVATLASANNIQVTGISTSNLTFASGTPTGSTSTNGGLETIIVYPTVTTTAATSVTTTTAQLNGTVNADGVLATNKFDWGDNTQTPPFYVTTGATPTTNQTVSGTSNTSVALTLSSLVSNTLYNFRLNSSNVNGPVNGSNLTFITPPNAPTGITASASTTTGFTVNWTAPTNIGAGYTFTVIASTHSDFSSGNTTQSGIASGTTTYTFTNLSSLTNYYYEVQAVSTLTGAQTSTWNTSGSNTITTAVVASNSNCSSSNGNGNASTTPAIIVDAPSAPTIDGIVDAIWSKAPVNNANTSVSGTVNNSATWQAMWDGNYLYVLVQVTDAAIVTASGNSFGSKNNTGNPWDRDGVEIFIDGDHNRGGAYDTKNDFQIRFNAGMGGSGTSNITGSSATPFNTLAANTTFATAAVTGGYVVEAKIPWSYTLGGINSNTAGSNSPTSGYYSSIVAGNLIGFDLTVNDNDNTAAGNNARQVISAWHATSGQTDEYQNTTEFGHASLFNCDIPVLSSPSATSVTNTTATLGATVTSASGGTFTSGGSGIQYSTNSGFSTATVLPLSGTPTEGTGFTISATGLSPQTLYYYKGYSTTNIGIIGVSSSSNFYTLSNPPSGQASGLNASIISGTQVNLSWTGASFPAFTGATHQGYLILRATNTSPVLGSSNGTSPSASTGSIIATIDVTSGTPSVTYNNTGMSSTCGNTYNYLVIPYTWDGANTTTYNYLTSGAPTASVTFTNPTALVLTGSTVCSGGTTSITSGTSATGINYQLYNGSAVAQGSVQSGTGSGLSWSGIAAGTGYYAIGTNTSTNCTSTSNAVNVVVNSLPTVSITSSATTICNGTTVNLTASGATSYVWASPLGVSVATASAAPTTTITYTVTGTDSQSPACSATAIKVITVNSLPTVSVASSATTVCSGTAVNLTASGATSYVWASPLGVSVATASDAPTATITYTVTGTDSNSPACSATATKVITVNPLPTANAGIAGISTCSSTSITLGGITTGSGGTGTLTYSWGSNPSGYSSTLANPTVDLAQTTTYTVTVSDANSCSATSSVVKTKRDNIKFTSVSNGIWSSGSTWDQGLAPQACDSVVISNGKTITFDSNGGTCAALNIQSGGAYIITNTSHSWPSGATVTANSGSTVNINTGSSVTFDSQAPASFGNLIISSGSTLVAPSTLTIGGNFENDGTFTHNNGTVVFNGTTTSTTISGNETSFNNITISGVLFAPNANMNVAGDWINNNTFNNSGGTVTFNGTSAISGSTISKFNNVIISLSSSLTGDANNMYVDGNWTNNGTFTHNGGKVTFDGTTSISGSSTNSFKHITITGSLTAPSSNINVAGDWTNNGTFTNSSGKVIFNGNNINTPSIYSGSTTTTFYDAEIAANSSLKVLSGNTMNVENTLWLKATDSSTIAQLVCEDNTAYVKGIHSTDSVYIQWYDNSSHWHYISTPVSNSMAKTTFYGFFLKKWTENTGTYSTVGNNEILVKGQGYPVAWNNTTLPYSPSRTLVFKAPITVSVGSTILNSGTISLAVTNTTNKGDGWNLVGNPYPSAIDFAANSGWNNINIDPTIYCYDAVGKTYRYYNITDGPVNGGSRYIPPMQGVYVHCTGSSGTWSMNNSVRVAYKQAFWKGASENTFASNVFNLKVSGNGYSDETMIGFNLNATKGFDVDHDVYKLYSPEEIVPQINVKTLDGSNTSVALKFLPTDLEKQVTVPVEFAVGEPGIYTISAINALTDNSVNVTLEDLKTGKITNIQDNSYTFTSNAVEKDNRFLLHFGAEPTSIKDKTLNDMITVYSDKNQIVIQNNSSNNDKAVIMIYDILGKQITSREMILNSLTRIDVDNAQGIYFVKIMTDNKSMTKKVCITR